MLNLLSEFPGADFLRLVISQVDGSLVIYLPWQMVFYLLAGLAMGVVVSLLTKPVDDQKLDRFYALVRTPVLTDEGNPTLYASSECNCASQRQIVSEQ